jgi:hypothetical protein
VENLAVYSVFNIYRAVCVAAVAVLAVTGVVGCCVVDCFDFVSGILLVVPPVRVTVLVFCFLVVYSIRCTVMLSL